MLLGRCVIGAETWTALREASVRLTWACLSQVLTVSLPVPASPRCNLLAHHARRGPKLKLAHERRKFCHERVHRLVMDCGKRHRLHFTEIPVLLLLLLFLHFRLRQDIHRNFLCPKWSPTHHIVTAQGLHRFVEVSKLSVHGFSLCCLINAVHWQSLTNKLLVS